MNPLLGRERALDLAAKAVEAAKTAGADEAEAVLMTDTSAVTRFADGQIHQNVGEENAELRLRVVSGGRVAVTASNRLADGAVRDLATRALDVARAMPADEEFAGLPEAPGDSYIDQQTFFDSTASVGAGDRAVAVDEIRSSLAAVGASAYGVVTNGVAELTVVNSRGVAAHQAFTDGWVSVIAEREGASGWVSAGGRDWEDLDIAGVTAKAADKCRPLSRTEVAPGRYDVILEEEAVAEVLNFLGFLAFNGLAYAEDRSLFSGRMGETPYPAHITLRDDPTDRRGPTASFDFEGMPKAPLPLIKAGRVAAMTTDHAVARRLGVLDTGHGLPAPNTYGPVPTNLVLSEGRPGLDEMVGDVERGLLVTRFHYVNTVDPARAVLTGMTRDGTFLIEHGEVVARTQDLRWLESADEVLRRTASVGRSARLISEGPGYGLRFMTGVVAPPLLVDGFSITGSAS